MSDIIREIQKTENAISENLFTDAYNLTDKTGKSISQFCKKIDDKLSEDKFNLNLNQVVSNNISLDDKSSQTNNITSISKTSSSLTPSKRKISSDTEDASAEQENAKSQTKKMRI